MTYYSLLQRYRENVERTQRGGLLDREVDRLMDEQDRLAKQIRQAVAPKRVVELTARPWIEVRE